MPVPAPLLALYTPESLLDPANGLLPPSTIAQIKQELSQKKKVIDHVTFECRLSTTGKYIDHVAADAGLWKIAAMLNVASIRNPKQK